jgi:hypothetical protein
MDLTKIFIAIAAIGVAVYIIVSIMIYNELKKRDAILLLDYINQ